MKAFSWMKAISRDILSMGNEQAIAWKQMRHGSSRSTRLWGTPLVSHNEQSTLNTTQIQLKLCLP
jgi:hypothetical protein